MTRDQKTVAVGAASGVATMLALLWFLYTALPAPSGAEQLANRLAYAARWNAVAVLPLLVMLAAIGNARFLSEAIDPTLGKEDRKMLIDGRVAENTLQQFVLFAVASLALAAAIEGEAVGIVGAAAITFVIMRTAFWIGYRIRPIYRAFGFAATAYMNVGLLAAALWLSVS
jgi:hypothetical protein